ncbi:MAG: MarR family winged helix-turn-helix transcriptional regulator [Solirubrobacteraceae bacterium]
MAPHESAQGDATVGHRERVGFLLARIGRGAWLRFEEALRPLALRPRHVVILMELRDRDATTQQALLEDLGFDAGNLVVLLNDLESQGLATRKRDPADRRRHIVQMTRAGTARLAEAESALREAEDTLLAPLDAAARDQLQSLLLAIE